MVPLEAGKLFRFPHLWGDELELYAALWGAGKFSFIPGVSFSSNAVIPRKWARRGEPHRRWRRGNR
jgi:hypothetical protein